MSRWQSRVFVFLGAALGLSLVAGLVVAASVAADGSARAGTSRAPGGSQPRLAHCSMERRITGFRQDEHGDWVAELECGHLQHVRHHPLWTNRP